MSETLQAMITDSGMPLKTITEFVEGYFPEATVFDYKVVAGIIRLYVNLPGSHSTTSIVKTLRGKAIAPVCTKQPDAGLLGGIKEYNTKLLGRIIEGVEALLREGDVAEKDEFNPSFDGEHDAPEWLSNSGTRQVNKPWGNKIANVFEECGKVYGKTGPELQRSKVNTIRIKDLMAKLTASGEYAKALAKAKGMAADYAATHDRFKICRHVLWYKPTLYSKSVKDGLTVKLWFTNEEVLCYYNCATREEEKNAPPSQAPLLVTKWTEDGQSLLSCDVVMIEYAQ